MKIHTALVAVFATTALATVIPELRARQNNAEAEVQKVIDDARAASAEKIRTDSDDRGRRLSETQCGDGCKSCRAGAVTKAVGEIALCGVAALGLEAATLGAATILELVGFVACEATVIGSLQESEANCNALG